MPKSTEAGHHEKRVYISQDGNLVVPSSAAIKVEAGGLLIQKPSTGGLPAIYTTKPSTNLSARGVSVIRTTDSVGPLTLSQPTPSLIGSEKIIVYDTTATIKLRLATGAGLRDVRCGTSSASVIVFTTALGKWTLKSRYAVITLRAMSTDKWIVTSMSPSPTTGSAFITFTSCT